MKTKQSLYTDLVKRTLALNYPKYMNALQIHDFIRNSTDTRGHKRKRIPRTLDIGNICKVLRSKTLNMKRKQSKPYYQYNIGEHHGNNSPA